MSLHASIASGRLSVRSSQGGAQGSPRHPATIHSAISGAGLRRVVALQGDRPGAEGTAASGGGVPGFELKPSGRSLTGAILIATRSPLSNLARDGPTPITRFSKYFWRKSSRILFCTAASLVISALPIKAGPVAEPIH